MTLIVYILGILQVYLNIYVAVSAPFFEPTLAPPQCKDRHHELTIPFISDARRHFVQYAVFNSGNNIPYMRYPEKEPRDKGNIRLLQGDNHRSKLRLSVRWRKRIFQLILTKRKIISSTAFTEWEENNTTVIRQFPDDCFYQGYVSGHEQSYAVITTCDGITGMIRVKQQELYIEPIDTKSLHSHGSGRPHQIYACRTSGSKADLENDTDRTEFVRPSNIQFANRRRRRRQLDDRKRYMEMLIVTDNSVIQFHGRHKYELYILTVMNIVNSVYQDPSLGVNIDIILVKIIVLDDSQIKRIVVERNAKATLDRFCDYSSQLIYNDPHNPQNHDLATLLTRRDIGPAGYAPVTGLCLPHRSCTVNKDEGLSSAFVVAHEAAHVFGLEHDGQRNYCSGPKYHGSIMAPMVESNYANFFWSTCSMMYMRRVVAGFNCLYDDPYKKTWQKLLVPLGSSWTQNEQCRSEFGTGYSVCRAFRPSEQCHRLWCSHRSNPLLCKTKKGPPIEGTECGYKQWCINQTCVFKEYVKPVHGGWGSWTPWGDCNTPCGNGVRFRTKKCNNPSPQFGGNRCLGQFEEFGICLQEPCESRDLREEQCTQFNDLVVARRRHTWLPFQNTSSQCDLTCISEETGDLLITDSEVMDGTPCVYEDPYNLCIRGNCVKAGCDGEIGSTVRVDSCGNCGGDNSKCKTVHGLYNKTFTKDTKGYQRVMVLPKGARNIEIAEMESSPHFMAVKDHNIEKYYLNGDEKQGKSRDFIANGARFIYTRSSNFESIVSRGPLSRELYLMLYPSPRSHESAITYQYTAKKTDYTFEKYKYKWKFDDWTPCSEKCGPGKQKTKYLCSDRDTNEVIEEKNCEHLKPARIDIVDCNWKKCIKTRWSFEGWGDCSETCGASGLQKRFAVCQSLEENTVEVISDDECADKDRPTEARPCNRFPCPLFVSWALLDWGECSQTCGTSGTQEKGLKCQRSNEFSTETVPDEECGDAERPMETQACNQVSCPVTYQDARWTILEWGECSVSCGYYGVQTQSAVCQAVLNGDLVPVTEEHCRDYEKPEDIRECNVVPCAAKWLTGEWSECTKTCGTGMQVRTVRCDIPEEEIGFECSEEPPADSKPCKKPACPRYRPSCKADRSRFCKRVASVRNCAFKRYKLFCCKSCEKFT